MTVKMCIKPFASPINKFTEPIGVCRSFNRQLVDKHLHAKQNISLKKKVMPKKPQIIRKNGALGSVITTQKLADSIVKFRENRYGLRAANERISSRKENDFIYDVDKLSSVPKVQVKNAGDNFLFVCHDQNQEEEREGGIVETLPKPSVLEGNNNNLGSKEVETGEGKAKNPLNIKKTSVDGKQESNTNFHGNGGSEKASAGTMAFVQILLHTLSCRYVINSNTFSTIIHTLTFYCLLTIFEPYFCFNNLCFITLNLFLQLFVSATVVPQNGNGIETLSLLSGETSKGGSIKS